MVGMTDVLAEHRAGAELTALDVAVLKVFTVDLRAVLAAATDDQLDRAAARLGALISRLPYTHPIVVAARLGVEVGYLRRQHRADMVAAGHALASAQDWHRAAAKPSFAELQRRRGRRFDHETQRWVAA